MTVSSPLAFGWIFVDVTKIQCVQYMIVLKNVDVITLYKFIKYGSLQ